MRKLLLILPILFCCSKQPGLTVTAETLMNEGNPNIYCNFIAYNNTDRTVQGIAGKIVFADVFGDVIADRPHKYTRGSIGPRDSVRFSRVFWPEDLKSGEAMEIINAYAYKKLTTRCTSKRVVWGR